MHKWDAADYHKSSAAQQKWGKELIAKLALNGTERVLDIGCGDGKITAEIARRLPDGFVLGIDSSPDMIAFALQNFSLDKSPNLAFQVMDARELNFTGEFDVVFSNAALHWVIDHLPILRGVKKSLKPSGRVLFQMGGRGNAAKVFELIETLLKSPRWREYFADFSFPYGFYGPEQYTDWLISASLEPKRVELVTKDMIHSDKEKLKAWIRTTWLPYTHRIPVTQRDTFIETIATEYIDNNPLDSDGSIHVEMVRLEVEAENTLETTG